MEASIISALVQAGPAAVVAGMFIWYLVKRDKTQSEKDKALQDFFKQMHDDDNKSTARLVEVIDSLVEKVERLDNNFSDHDKYEREKIAQIENEARRPTKPRDGK